MSIRSYLKSFFHRPDAALMREIIDTQAAIIVSLTEFIEFQGGRRIEAVKVPGFALADPEKETRYRTPHGDFAVVVNQGPFVNGEVVLGRSSHPVPEVAAALDANEGWHPSSTDDRAEVRA